MEQSNNQFPAEEVTLPSKGLLYPEESPLKSGIIEMKYMTAKEEDILTNQNLIANGTVIDKLLQSLIVSPISYNDLLVGDKNAILVAARILGYGANYSFTQDGVEHTVDLSELKDKFLDESLVIDGKNEFSFTLPTSKKEITFKLLTHEDEKNIDREIKGLQKINSKGNFSSTTNLKYTILSVDGDYEKKTIRNFVDTQLLARDARELRKYIEKIQPNTNLVYDYEDSNGNIVERAIPVGINFFWPDASI